MCVNVKLQQLCEFRYVTDEDMNTWDTKKWSYCTRMRTRGWTPVLWLIMLVILILKICQHLQQVNNWIAQANSNTSSLCKPLYLWSTTTIFLSPVFEFHLFECPLWTNCTRQIHTSTPAFHILITYSCVNFDIHGAQYFSIK